MVLNSSNARIAKNSFYLMIRMFFTLIISLYTTRLVLQILGVVDYGIYNLVCGFVSLFAFLNTAMSNSIQRFYNFEIGSAGNSGTVKVYNASFRSQFLILVILILLSEIIGLWYINTKLVVPIDRLNATNWVFQLSVLSFSFMVLQVPFTSAIMAYERMDYFSIVGIIDVCLKLLFVLLLKKILYDKLIIYGFLQLAVSILNYLMYFIYVKYSFKHLKLTKECDIRLLKSMLSFSGWNTLGSFANIARTQGLNILINLFAGPVVNAARAIAFQVESAVQGFVANMTTAARPQIIQEYATGNLGRSLSLMMSISKLSFIVLYVLILPIIYEVDYVLNLWLGTNVPDYTPTFVIIILLTTIIINLNTPVSIIVHATGKMRDYQIYTSLVSLLTIPISFIVLKIGYGPEYILIVSLIMEIIKQFVSLLLLKRLVDFSIQLYCRSLLLPILSVLLLTFWVPIVPLSLMTASFLRLIIVFFVSMTCILSISYILMLSKNEKNLVRDFLSKILRRR